jgi:tetratricopeptide (TPR) repeat protein/S1-C subfamily serine protease
VGQGGGSGVLLAKKGGTYLVLTNAHVVQGQAGVSITTPDGLVHGAQRVKNAQVGDFDLALLEFNSAWAYQLAGLANFETRGGAKLTEKDPVFAAGFPYDANGLKLLGGKITQLPQEAFKNGTQVGYVTQGDLVQGMSGGPVLDSVGNLVGINSTLARPVIDSYVYADGSKAPDDKVAEYRQANWSVPMYNLLTRLNPDVLYSYQQLPKLHRSITPTGYMAELGRKARAVTVRIERGGGGNGSGVIVARDGNSYYVLTADHVVKKSDGLKVVTHDQRVYQISDGDVKRSEGTDLAVVKFTSSESYRSATLGNYSIAEGATVFSGGWPDPKYINSQQWQWQINPGGARSKDQGELQTQSKLSFSDGYDLIYSSITYGGMSGGPVFDRGGRVIGIHGRAEAINGNILGNSLGISIRTFLGLAKRLNVQQQNLQIATTPPGNITGKQIESIALILNNVATPNNNSNVNQWLEYGNQLYRLGKYTDAVKAFDRAIKLRPNLPDAYYGEGLALWGEGNSIAALVSFDRAIALTPSGNKSSYYLWRYYGAFLRNLQRYPEAFVAISQAVRLEPQDITLLNEKAVILMELKRFSEAINIYNEIIKREEKNWAYSNRGNVKYQLGDKKGAILDYDKAISINPQSAFPYANRGNVKYQLGDKKGAILDYDKAISINFLFANGYHSRGTVKYQLGDKKGAILDYDKAIAIDPQFVNAYNGRGNAKSELGDKKGAILDYDKAIAIDPQFVNAYNGRGNAKSELGDKKGAILDYDKAITINPQDANAYDGRGTAKYQLGDKKGAILDYDKAIAMNPQYAEAYSNRGTAKLELGDKKGAILDYDKAIIINPQYARAYSNRGTAKLELGDKKGAILDYNKAIIINPQYARAYYNRGLTKLELGDKKGAILDYDKAIIINPQLAEAYYNRGLTKLELGDKKGAMLDYDKAITINPQLAEAYYSRGLAKFELGDKKGEILDYDKAITINPQHAKAYSNRGLAKFELGDKKGAIFDYDKAIIINPQLAEAYYNRGLTKLELGDKKGAIFDYDKAITINPQFANAYSNRGLVKYQLGDRKGAIFDYDKAITINPQFANAYFNRGIAKYQLGDEKGVIEDLKIAAQLFKTQNNQQEYNRAIELIQTISNP